MPENHERGVSRHAVARGTAADLGYDYHWGRIAGAALAVLLLIALAIYLALRLFGAEPAVPAENGNSPAAAITTPQAPSEAPSKPDVSPASPDSGTSLEPPSAERTAEEPMPAPLPQPAAPPDELPPAVNAAPSGDPVPVQSTARTDQPATAIADGAAPATAPSGLTDFAVATPSPSIARARFAAAIRDNEPEGDPASIEANEEGLVRVFFFTEVKNRKGTPLAYRWLRDGKRVATVNAGAWNDAWRSYSSKFITPAQQGTWRVELVDDKGEVLAAGTFDYRR